MTKNLNNSSLDRQNILNNPFALTEIENRIELKGIKFEEKLWFTTQQVADYFEVDIRTIRNYLDKNDIELRQNGYKIFTGKRLEDLKKVYVEEFGFLDPKLQVTPSIGMFDFRSFLNLGMLLNDGQKAKELRSLILGVVISIMNNNYGKDRKYINQNDPLYNFAINEYHGYHDKLKDSLANYVEMGNNKYLYFNDKIYQFLFLERYKEYKSLLELKSTEKPISTQYSEVITTISTFETAFAQEIRENSNEEGKKLTKEKVETIFRKLIYKEMWEPLLGYTREIIASRDLCFRDILHPNLSHVIRPIGQEEYQKFIGESKLLGPNFNDSEKKQIEEIQTQNLFEEFAEPEITNVFIRMNNK